MPVQESTAVRDVAVSMEVSRLPHEGADRDAGVLRPRPRSFSAWLGQPGTGEPLPRTDPHLPVLVVGAGPAGLAAMSALREAGVEFEGIEFHSGVGGIWDQANPLSTVYDNLTTNTSRYTTHLGPSMPADWPAYPHHRLAHGYLQKFADESRLLPQIRFLTSFEGARKTERNTWIAALRSVGGHQSDAREYRAIVMATGLNNKKNRLFPERLRAEAVAAGLDVIHACDYRNSLPYVGKRVLVVGLGVSGADIATEVSQVAERTLLSYRTIPWIVPLNLFGRPGDRASLGPASRLPFRLQRECFRIFCSLAIGRPGRFGLPVPTHQLFDRFAIADRGIREALKSGRVSARPALVAFEGGCAVFDDGRPEPVDAVVFATGYERRYPLLDQLPRGNQSLSECLPFLLFHPADCSLAYLSEVIAPYGAWPIFREQARAIAAFFAAEQRQARRAEEFNVRRSLPSPDVKGQWYQKEDGFHVDAGIYFRTLRTLSDWLSGG